MKIEKDRVVRFHYAVAEAGKESVENSKDGGQPLAILFGHGNIIPGLEKAMEGKEAGDSFKANVPAAEAYGERREGLSQRIPKKHFGAQKLEPGMQVVLQTNFGPRAVTVEKVGTTSTTRWPARTWTSTSRSSRCAKPPPRNWRTATSTATAATSTDHAAHGRAQSLPGKLWVPLCASRPPFAPAAPGPA